MGHPGAGRRVVEHAVDADGVLVLLAQQECRGPSSAVRLTAGASVFVTSGRCQLPLGVRWMERSTEVAGRTWPEASTMVPLPCRDSASPMCRTSATAARAVALPTPYISTI